MELSKLKNIYFLGIGGIGMSALARFFASKGVSVSGYDKTSTPLTKELEKEGISIHYADDTSLIPQSPDLVIYTPAIPADLLEWEHVHNLGCPIMKRSEILGLLSKDYFTIAIAGTHGKTSITSMVAHILQSAGMKITAFMGGISKNYHSNLIVNPDSEIFVVEADEFDKSFLTLNPDIAIVSSVDADHLDIYKTHQNLIDTFNQFVHKVKTAGKVLIRKNAFPESLEKKEFFTYSIEGKSNIVAKNIRILDGNYVFDLQYLDNEIHGLVLSVPGRHNVENATAAISVAMALQISPEVIKTAIASYTGVKRRFDYQIKTPKLIYIDDYAHHPEEIRAFVNAIKELYPEKEITGIFQPHLFSRTQDFMEGFAKSLSLLDNLILLDIYPAREKPIEGVSSEALLQKVTSKYKTICPKDKVIDLLQELHPEIILTIGAGDIDQLIEPIVNHYQTFTA